MGLQGPRFLLTWLLDTNVVSEFRKVSRGRADPRVTAWAMAQPARTLFVSVITLFELERGVLVLERRDPTAGRHLRAWLDGPFHQAFHDRILVVDAPVVRRCASLHVPDPKPDRDSLIAATAFVHGFTVVTRDVADFAPMGVPIFNPWG